MNYSPIYSDLYDPAFPVSSLDVRTELLLGGVWTDVSKSTYQRAGFQIGRGHADETSTVQPSVAALQVNNRGGQFSPRNPMGAFYGVLGRNTPCRISLPDSTSYLRMEDDAVSYASCPDRPSLDVTGDIDVRIDVRPSNYARTTLVAKAELLTGQESWNFFVDASGLLHFVWSADGTSADSFAVISTVAIPLGRIALRATLSVATGTVTFYTAPTISGTWTQLGVAASGTSGAATSIYNLASPIQIGYAPGGTAVAFQGKVYAFQLYSGIGGTLVASPNFVVQPPGTAPFADAQGNVWSVNGTAQISNRRYRHHGEVPAWPQRWDETGNDVYVPITPSGLLRRYTQGTPPQYSALFRAFGTLTGAAAPVAYWPCEDGVDAQFIASGLPAGAPMQFSGTPSFAANSDFVCSQPIPVLNGSSWTGSVEGASSWASNTCRFLMEVPSGGDANLGVIARMYTSGTVGRLDLVYNAGGDMTLTGYTGLGAQLFTSGPFSFGGSINGQLVWVTFEIETSGTGLAWSVNTYTVLATHSEIATGTLASSTLGAVSSVVINPGGALVGTAIGHVDIQAQPNSLGIPSVTAINANLGETAATRFARLCAEQGVPCRIYGLPADSIPMGYQDVNDFVSLLQECEDADRGLIYEPRQALALGYRTRASLYNQTPIIAATYTAAHLSPPIEPTDDDQTAMNDVTVTRAFATAGTSTDSTTGSSAREYLPTGAMSTQSPPNGIGEYASQLSLNLATDPSATQLAGWILNVGTVDAPRYPTLTFDLTRSELATLFNQILDADIGDLLTVAATPTWLPPDGISQILRGMSETLNTYTLTETFAGAPAAPYTVGVYDTGGSHYDTDGATIYGNPSATTTTIQVATGNPHSPLWTTNAADFPFDIAVSLGGTSGERMTVTNITGTTSPQTFTVTRSVNGVIRGWPNGADVRLFQPAIYSL